MTISGISIDTRSDNARVVKFDSAVYRLDSVKKAAHKYLEYLYVLISNCDAAIEVQIYPKECCKFPDGVVGDFCNEVLDQELRETIAEETRGVRDLLLAQTFSKTCLIDPESETAEYAQKNREVTPAP